MKLRTLMFTALLAVTGAAFGATPPPPASTAMGPDHHQGPCEKDPSKCQADAAKFDQWCSANADKCTNLKAWAERRREACEKNADKCKERMEKMHEHMKEMRAEKQGGQPGPSDNNGPNDEPGDDQAPPPSF